MQPDRSTRETLVTVARDLFLAKGYHSTGIAEIVKAAGVHPGSLYYHFPTKEDLLIAVLEWYRDNIYEGLLKPVWERVSDPIERIFGILDGYRQLILLTNFDLGCPIGNLALEITNTHPKARELLQANFENWVDQIEGCLNDAEGRLPSDLDRRSLAVHVLTVMEGAVMVARTARKTEPFDMAIVQLRDYLDRLLSDGTEWASPIASRSISHFSGNE